MALITSFGYSFLFLVHATFLCFGCGCWPPVHPGGSWKRELTPTEPLLGVSNVAFHPRTDSGEEEDSRRRSATALIEVLQAEEVTPEVSLPSMLTRLRREVKARRPRALCGLGKKLAGPCCDFQALAFLPSWVSSSISWPIKIIIYDFIGIRASILVLHIKACF